LNLSKTNFHLPKIKFALPSFGGQVSGAAGKTATTAKSATTGKAATKGSAAPSPVISAAKNVEAVPTTNTGKSSVSSGKEQIAVLPIVDHKDDSLRKAVDEVKSTQPAKAAAEAAKQRVADRIQQEPAVVKAAVSGEELKGLAQYNRLLADYFSKQHDDKKEPPSYSEWLAGDRQAF
jgi:hypothetical protein